MPALDYYATLGVRPEASDEDIKKAYRQMVLRYHPDRNPGNAQAEVRIREINAAYEVLGDPETRRTYERLRFGAERADRYEEETVDPDVVLHQMEAKLQDEGRKELFAILMKEVPRIKDELAVIRQRTVAQQGYDSFKESVVAERGREVLDDLLSPDQQIRSRRLLDVAVQMMISQRVVGPNDESGIRRVRGRLEAQYRTGLIAGYMSALELFYVRQ